MYLPDFAQLWHEHDNPPSSVITQYHTLSIMIIPYLHNKINTEASQASAVNRSIFWQGATYGTSDGVPSTKAKMHIVPYHLKPAMYGTTMHSLPLLYLLANGLVWLSGLGQVGLGLLS